MNKKTLPIVIIILVLAVGLGIFVVIMKNKGIPQNPENTVGNTGGNLNNGGFFCESDDTIYFANPYDSGCLYKMKTDRTDIKKVSGAAVAYLNYAGDYLYYYQRNSAAASSLGFVVRVSGLYRSDLSGKHTLCLDKVDCDRVVLIGNKVYYTKAVDGAMTLCLHSVTTNKKNLTQLTDFLLNPSSASDQIIYYSGTKEDHYLYAYDTRTGLSTLLAQYQMWFPTYYGNSIYFLDLSNNYRLSRLNMADGSVSVLTKERVEAFNVYGGYAYYQTTDSKNPGIYMVNIDGSNPVLLAQGNYHNINIVAGYVYFQNAQTDIPLYMAPVGSSSVATFDDAKSAALKNMK